MISKIYCVLALSVISCPLIYSNDTTMTNWKIEPSLKYDACCFLNILTGDEFYLTYYQDEYDKFQQKLTPQVKDALRSLKKKVKEDNGTIISAWLCLYFSAVSDSTLGDIRKTLDNTAILEANFSKTPYHSEEGWALFNSVNSELKSIFDYLIKIDFEGYWKANILPAVNDTINSIKPELPKYDVIKENEYFLGYKLPSDTITVYMLNYAKPHGIKITGTRFLTNVGWPFKTVIRTAAHEMMHPPYDYQNDEEIRNIIELFRSDDFVMDKVNNHNPSLGYNTLEGLFEEDCVQTMDQLIAEKLGVAKDAKKRWQESDEGIHVLAIALYQIMKDENYNEKGEKLRDFLIRIVSSKILYPGKIKEYYDKFY
jgi:hypothetical protein